MQEQHTEGDSPPSSRQSLTPTPRRATAAAAGSKRQSAAVMKPLSRVQRQPLSPARIRIDAQIDHTRPHIKQKARPPDVRTWPEDPNLPPKGSSTSRAGFKSERGFHGVQISVISLTKMLTTHARSTYSRLMPFRLLVSSPQFRRHASYALL